MISPLLIEENPLPVRFIRWFISGCWVSHLPGIQSPAMPSLVLIERPRTGLGSGRRNLSGPLKYDLLIFGWIEKPFIRFSSSGFSGAMRNLLKIAMFFLRQHGEFMPSTAEKQRRMAVVESFFESGWNENQENLKTTGQKLFIEILSNPKSTQESWKSSLETEVICIMGINCKSTIFSAGAFYTL